MIVVDTSAVLSALMTSPATTRLQRRLADDGDLHVPHLLDVEILHALRRLVTTGALSDERAQEVRDDVDQLALTRYPHGPLADRIWELRHNLSAYDATFVSLCEALDVPFVTCDARLARAPAHHATVELYAVG